MPHSLGIGGGFVATIYKQNKGDYKMECLIARESAPKASHKDMFLHRKITGELIGKDHCIKQVIIRLLPT